MKNKRKALAAQALAVIATLAFMFGGVPYRTLAQGSATGAVMSRGLGTYDASKYAIRGEIVSGNASTGSQTITICANSVLADGRTFNPFGNQNGTFAPISVDLQSTSAAETVTPTAISLVSAPANAPASQTCANVTATFSNTHGASLNTRQVVSGDSGIQEAFNDAAANGGGHVFWAKDCGIITVSTSSVTTTTGCTIPKTFTNVGASVHVTTAVTTSASYSVGIATATAAFISACTSLTAATDCSQFQVSPTKVATGAGLGALLITTNAAAGAGALHVTVWGTTEVQSNN